MPLSKSLIASTIAVIASFSSASALTIEYEYVGQPFYCPRGEGVCGTGEDDPGFKGSLTIYEEYLPFKSIANATLSLNYKFSADYENDIFSYTLAKGSESYSYTLIGQQEYDPDNPSATASYGWKSDPAFAFLDFSNIIGTTLFNIIQQEDPDSGSGYIVVFGPSRKIVSWSGVSGLQGGDNDFGTSEYGDQYASGATSIGPGSWNIVSRSGKPSPSPIPVPASMFLSIAGMAVLGLISIPRRRRRGAVPSWHD